MKNFNIFLAIAAAIAAVLVFFRRGSATKSVAVEYDFNKLDPRENMSLHQAVNRASRRIS